MDRVTAKAHLTAYPVCAAVKIRGNGTGKNSRGGWAGGVMKSVHPTQDKAFVRPHGHGKDELLPLDSLEACMSRSIARVGMMPDRSTAGFRVEIPDKGSRGVQIAASAARSAIHIATAADRAVKRAVEDAGLSHTAGRAVTVEIVQMPVKPPTPPADGPPDVGPPVDAPADAAPQIEPQVPPADPEPLPVKPAAEPPAKYIRCGWVIFDKIRRTIWDGSAFSDGLETLDRNAAAVYAQAPIAYRARTRLERQGHHVGQFDPHGLTVDTLDRAMDYLLYAVQAPAAAGIELAGDDPIMAEYRAVLDAQAAVRAAEIERDTAEKELTVAENRLGEARDALAMVRAAAVKRLQSIGGQP
jgi:hypothetical protein